MRGNTGEQSRWWNLKILNKEQIMGELLDAFFPSLDIPEKFTGENRAEALVDSATGLRLRLATLE